ncbi:RNA-directed DNA polymerase, eukaryota [Tanacetum coccineum]
MKAQVHVSRLSLLSDTERLSLSDEVLKLKNFKKDATLKLSKSTNQKWYKHVGPDVTSSQDDKRLLVFFNDESQSGDKVTSDNDVKRVSESIYMHNNDLLYGNNHNNINPDKDKILSEDLFNIYDILNKRKDIGDDLKYPRSFTPSVINVEEVNKKEKGATSNEVNKHVNSTSNKLEEFVLKGKLSSNNSVCSKRVHTGGSILQLIDELVNVGQTMGYNMEGCMRNIKEAKIESMELVTIKTLWGNSSFDYALSSSLGNLWGILCVWKPTLFVKDNVTLSDNFLAVMDLIRKKVGNGLNTLFWEDPWLDDLALKHKFLRLYALDNYKQITIVDKINHASMVDTFRRPPRGGVEKEQLNFLLSRMDGLIVTNILDRWVWSLEATSEFSIKYVRQLIDDSIIPNEEVATRWVKVMPIKINVFAWRVRLDKLPTRLILSLKGIDISTIVCPLCHASIESGSRIFFSCPMARQLWRKLMRWWELEDIDLASYDYWLLWLNSSRLSKRLKEILEGVCYVKWWLIWRFRNQLLFGATNPRRELLFDDLVLQYFESKTKALGLRMYDMINRKWKTVHPNMAQFYGTYANVMRMAQESGVEDEDYFIRVLLEYEVEHEIQFTLRHFWEVLKGSPKWMQTKVSKDKAKGSKNKGPRSSGSSSSMNDEALARLMVSELAMHNKRAIKMKKEGRLAFMEIWRMEVECREQELAM